MMHDITIRNPGSARIHRHADRKYFPAHAMPSFRNDYKNGHGKIPLSGRGLLITRMRKGHGMTRPASGTGHGTGAIPADFPYETGRAQGDQSKARRIGPVLAIILLSGENGHSTPGPESSLNPLPAHPQACAYSARWRGHGRRIVPSRAGAEIPVSTLFPPASFSHLRQPLPRRLRYPVPQSQIGIFRSAVIVSPCNSGIPEMI